MHDANYCVMHHVYLKKLLRMLCRLSIFGMINQ